jgi:hypothetical protein
MIQYHITNPIIINIMFIFIDIQMSITTMSLSKKPNS